MRYERFRALATCAIVLGVYSLCFAQAPAPTKGKIKEVRFSSFPPTEPDGSVKFDLEIEGENLPPTTSGVTVLFDYKDPAHSITCMPATCEPSAASEGKEIVLKGTAKAETEVTRIRIVQNGETKADTAKDFTLTIKANPAKSEVKQFVIKLEHEKNKQFPNLHTVVLTRESGEGGFADNPHWMTVDLMPSGASDINIVQASREQLDVHFIAAADYEPTSAVVTVYNGSDLDKRVVDAIAKKTPPDPNKPKVTGTETVFINRSHGVGRIRILGEGFGDYDPPPYQVDDYLWNCLEEFHIRATDPKKAAALEFDDIRERIRACADTLKGVVGPEAARELEKYEHHQRSCEEKCKSDGCQDECPDCKTCRRELDELAEKERNQLQATKSTLAKFVTLPGRNAPKIWETWAAKVRDTVTVSVNSRNPDIRVEKVDIVDVNDKMIDVYFEFTRYRGYAWPFRLADGTVVIKKKIPKTIQTVKNDKLTGAVTGPNEKIYSVPYEMGPKRNPDLRYRYIVLDKKSANTLLGRGIAENFYVVQVSVVNEGKKKVAIPLSAIQAEVEWARGEQKTTYGEDEETVTKMASYMVGPPTESPMPLAAVSAYFGAYQKVKGLRAYGSA